MRRAARGSAMVETVLALPVILLMLVAVIGFGVATKRLSPLENAARLDAWRRATPGAPGPSDDAQLRAALYPRDVPASLVRAGGDAALPAKVDQPLTSSLSDDPRALADDLLGRFPHALGSSVTVRHDSGIPFSSWIGFTAPITRTASRLNGDWRYEDGIRHLGQPWAAYPDGWHPQAGGPRISACVRSLFVADLDGALPADGGRLSQGIRDLYTWNPGYTGPNWILNPDVFPPGMDDGGP